MKKHLISRKSVTLALAALLLVGLSAALWFPGETAAWSIGGGKPLLVMSEGVQISGGTEFFGFETIGEVESGRKYDPFTVVFKNTSTMDTRARLRIVPVWQDQSGADMPLPSDNLIFNMDSDEWTEEDGYFELNRILKGADRLADPPVPADGLEFELRFKTSTIGPEYDGLVAAVYIFLELDSARWAHINP